ncbi:uncharacterized protein KY384_000625 [Bacidia gigantensis]|uniref:uncharacterized protein n=1 Tax=Bacidia gigantensis TaxID=2732470 RepID=UPI001D0487AC|nr:uncharacterized protein KY384_000625 [Bacidia gigantensis]KAG8525865.1 hypothetical protein KY384_000625 [Bacidia gigantensis]
MTFAPTFIQSDEAQRGGERVGAIEGENDFSGKRYVWVCDPETAFIKGWVLEELDRASLLVECEDGSQRRVDSNEVDKVNPAKFDRASDMAELTHLNEASVIHNLHSRYQSDLIYTYSGLFLVTVNPYCTLPIYTDDYVRMYRGQSREDTKPHIFAMADFAFRNLVEEGENQSILVTGESGAGKTENTKKVIQYFAAVATPENLNKRITGYQLPNLSNQILKANPILEAFGNAQTVRNNNSSRFGKFIRIEFTRSGQIVGAFIDWYLLEKSRVVRLNSSERNYHIFYQLLRGANTQLRKQLLLDDSGPEDFCYTKDGNHAIAGVSDKEEWDSLLDAFKVIGFTDEEQIAVFRTVAAVLLLGNISIMRESLRADQATLAVDAYPQAQKACQLLGIDTDAFVQGLLHPRVKAGREWVEKVQTPEQVRSSLHALSKGIYERAFGELVSRVNRRLGPTSSGLDDLHFIGVLDIAGFEIFEENSFEQLCINYTNEKLQQFFNHHMFVLEQEEYAREKIEWNFIDFGKDLQPTIELIELPNPIGIFSCLDEDSVMPKATDRTFTDKLHSLWDRKTPKYRASRLSQGFILTHYAAEVEYSTHGWLEKNKDPLNDNLTRLLAASRNEHMATLFQDCSDIDEDKIVVRNRVKKGLFRTVAQRHKEQLSSLMTQLHSTHPHFVRCILPNHRKRPKLFQAPLVLDQLRCNGVLEGIRIARTGFPNRLPFPEFRQRYEVLCQALPRGHHEGQKAVYIMLEMLRLDKAVYRIGLTKVFFRAGVLADLEEQRDALIKAIVSRFQSISRGFMQRKIAAKRLYRAEATRIIRHNFGVYLDLCSNPWWRLFAQMKPLLGATQTAVEVKKRDEMIQCLELKVQQENVDRVRLEDERRRADADLARTQQTLESERSLALDKEEIFKRLQKRETELNEKLAGAIEDQEKLEDQLDDLVDAKRKAEDQANRWREKLEQAGQIIIRLEADKGEMQLSIKKNDTLLFNLERTRSEKESENSEVIRERQLLESQFNLQLRKVSDLEGKLLRTDQDLEVKLSAATKDLHISRRQLGDLREENCAIRAQIDDLSSTSTDYESLLRRKESEVAILKADQKNFEKERKTLESEKALLASRHDSLQKRFREVQAEADAIKSQRLQFEREAADSKRLLNEKLSEDAQAGTSRKILESHVDELKADLFQVQTELSRERQSRDDVQMLSDHELATLKGEYVNLNESKITIEKELYIQQDTLRRAQEARTIAEANRKELQTELKKLRERYADAESSRIEAQIVAERSMSRQANERHTSLMKEMENKDNQLEEITADRSRLAEEAQSLRRMINESDVFRLQHDQHKERLERELVTVKGRLNASENDNRAFLNKIQQKNLDIARSTSRAGDSQRSRVLQLQAEKAKGDEDSKKLRSSFNDLQVSMASIEKQKEKLKLDVEDLHHEIEREHKATRNAEKTSANCSAQVVELTRTVESEKQVRSQAQANTRKIQSMLDATNREVNETRRQLALLHKVFHPESNEQNPSWEVVAPRLPQYTDLAGQLQACQQALRITNEKCSRAELQIQDMRQRFEGEIHDMDARHSSSKRHMLEEINQNILPTRKSPKQHRRVSDAKHHSNNSTPDRRHPSTQSHDSGRSDRTVDTMSYNRRMDVAAELEMVQAQLQMTEMQNRHLQSQLGRLSPTRGLAYDESPTARRVQKLERENGRLNEKLDDSTKKMSALEKSIRSGDLSLRDIQAKSHEELYDLINSQEDSRRSLLRAYDGTVADLTHAKSQFDSARQARASVEVELRDARSELEAVSEAHEHESAAKSRILSDHSDLNIRFDTEASRANDLEANLNLYKRRADEYFNKLEHAEIAVFKASRAEQHAKAQVFESEETYAHIVAERKQMDSSVEELQRQNQSYEARVEDLAADLETALQAKKRLQHELEDYRSQRAMDVDDKEATLEQTRRKYQSEFSLLTGELENERENVLHARSETSQLRDELEDLRSKWDDEVLNSSAWSKEKSRLEMTMEDLSSSREEAVAAHNDAQSKVISLLSQVRSLRNSMDDLAAEKDGLQMEKRSLESRLAEAGDRLEDLARGESPSMRNAAKADREQLELKTQLAQQQDVAAAAVSKMRKVDALSTEMQKDIVAERETTGSLHKEKAALEKAVKDLQGRVVDLETKGFSTAGHDARFLNGRIQELEHQLERQETQHADHLRSVRNVDRTVKDLQSQLERKDKTAKQFAEDVARGREKVDRLLSTIDELQAEEARSQLAARRAERDLREEKEKGLRLERELEGWKGLRVERGAGVRGSTSEWGGSIRGHRATDSSDTGDGLNRMLSTTKGFL